MPDTMLESGIPILTTWQAILKGLIAQIRQQHRLHTHLARPVKAKDSRESGDGLLGQRAGSLKQL